MDLCRVFDDAPVFIYALDLDQRYLYLNRSALDSVFGGRSLDQVVGRLARDLMPKEEWTDLEANNRLVIKRNRATQVYESLLGRVLYSNKWPLCSEQGDVIGVAGVSSDITSVVEERVRGDFDLDLMVKLMRNTSLMTRALTRMLDGAVGR